jgi:hypothetical protein
MNAKAIDIDTVDVWFTVYIYGLIYCLHLRGDSFWFVRKHIRITNLPKQKRKKGTQKKHTNSCIIGLCIFANLSYLLLWTMTFRNRTRKNQVSFHSCNRSRGNSGCALYLVISLWELASLSLADLVRLSGGKSLWTERWHIITLRFPTHYGLQWVLWCYREVTTHVQGKMFC